MNLCDRAAAPLLASRRSLLKYLAAMLLLIGLRPATGAEVGATPVRLTDNAQLRFASIDEGKRLLSIDDDYSSRLSPFDLAARTRGGELPTLAQWREQLIAEVTTWSDADIPRISTMVEKIAKRLEQLAIPLPEVVWLVQTTGREESNAAYTRGAAIMLPTEKVKADDKALEELIVHELFHVISRHGPELRRRLYSIVGFESINEIELPENLAKAKITNPDAPRIDCVITLVIDGKVQSVAPILVADPPTFDRSFSENMFRYLKFRLLVLEGVLDDKQMLIWQPSLREGEPQFIDPAIGSEAYLEKIGRNTKYIIHPDEILADNFAYLVLERKDLPTPRIVDEMLRVLAK